jgi:Zn-dependent peptidase ImmA (M78 family)/transcriptional regulator with XRE-family HTH domain
MNKEVEKNTKDAAFGMRLRAARTMAGLSMDDLVQKMGGGISRQALSKYELGLMKPSAKIRAAIESALGLLSFTVREETAPCYSLGGLAFRRKSCLPAKREEALKRRAVDFFMRLSEIEAVLGNRTVFQNPLRNPEIRTEDDVEKAALDVRQAWGLGSAPVSNVLGLLEFMGIKVYETSEAETGDGFDGMCARTNGVPVMVINRDRPADRIRFTAAHELSHILCGLDGNGEKERLCHRFAGAFLLPGLELERALVGKRRRITLWEIGAIKRTWGVSMQAIMHRATDLGLVTDGFSRQFLAKIKKNGWKINEPVEYEGREEAVRFKRLIHYAVSEGILDIEQGARFAGKPMEEFRKEMR